MWNKQKGHTSLLGLPWVFVRHLPHRALLALTFQDSFLVPEKEMNLQLLTGVIFK